MIGGLIVLVVAFGPWLPATTQCVTRCGLRAPVTGQACEALKRYETAALNAFENHHLWAANSACRALKGWTIYHAKNADEQGLFPAEDHPYGVWGFTYPDSHRIELGSFDWPNSALSHEMAHVISIVLEKDMTHDRWAQRGICRAINDVQEHLKCTRKDPSCLDWK